MVIIGDRTIATRNGQLNFDMINPVKNGNDEFDLAQRQVVRLEAVAGLRVCYMHRLALPRGHAGALVAQSADHLANCNCAHVEPLRKLNCLMEY